ncbi:LD-carboxypeptidase [Candidatus Aminicenantes bacterium AC-335-A11]|nr:LD-carboxypeptidase [SCandidatus Aminicenantes bacterium Aminicenantia_JdfR_composite]MCP2598022.1 LD-carboxypeptidase [Candidatus Aminicenantes bacterium AC-335-L06]MCP2619133.1 LD-carboxypeptidase [Candidatus Aminicenantes bacterium AC-335-A11]
MKKPKILKKNDVIGIFAPASPVKREFFQKGISELEKFGFKIKYSENIFQKKKFLAGDDLTRAQELIEFLKDNKVKALIGARGGYGSIRLIPILEKIDFSEIKPKILIGSSDLTYLLLYFNQKYKWVVFYGPMACSSIAKGNYDRKIFLHVLTISSPLPPLINGKVIKHGKAIGILTGGCLSLICSTIGTPYEIETTNKILILEDHQEKPYRIDRYLWQLKMAGKFEKIKGVVFGEMKDCFQHPEQGYELEDIINDFFQEYDFPVLYGFPFGHSEETFTLPLGIKVEIDSSLPGIKFLEEATVN